MTNSTLLKVVQPLVTPPPGPDVQPAEADPDISNDPAAGIVSSVTSIDPRQVITPNSGDVTVGMELTIGSTDGRLTVADGDTTNPTIAMDFTLAVNDTS